jgi:hypothetical protein
LSDEVARDRAGWRSSGARCSLSGGGMVPERGPLAVREVAAAFGEEEQGVGGEGGIISYSTVVGHFLKLVP